MPQIQSTPFNPDATIAALEVLYEARLKAVTGPSSAYQFVSHAYDRLDAELGDYLRATVFHTAAGQVVR